MIIKTVSLYIIYFILITHYCHLETYIFNDEDNMIASIIFGIVSIITTIISVVVPSIIVMKSKA